MSKKQIIVFIILSIIIIIFSIISINNNSERMPDIITENIISEIFSYILVSLFPVKKDKKDRVILVKNLTIFIFIYAILMLLVLSFSEEKNILYGILLIVFHIICFTGLLKKKKWAVFLYIPLNLGSLYFLFDAVNKNLTANAYVLSLFFFILLPLIIIVSDLYNWKKLN